MDRAQQLWERAIDGLSGKVAARAIAILQSDVLAGAEQINAVAAVIAAGQRRAVTAADVHLAVELSTQLERDIAVAGVGWMETADEQTTRIGKSVQAIHSADVAYAETPSLVAQSVALRLNRYVDGQISEAATWGRGEAGKQHAAAGEVIGWIRRTDGDPCRLCMDWRGSPPGVHSVNHRIALHKGRDRCSQQYVSSLSGLGKWLGTRGELRELLALGH